MAVKVVGLTGGIGSGKSTVAQLLIELGYSVYNSDLAAKKAYSYPEIVQKIIALFGDAVLDESQKVNFKELAILVFADKEKLQSLNNIIHPFVQKDFADWLATHEGETVFKEAAILFESGANESCDSVISVEADKKVRLKRVQKRDDSTEDEILARMDKQLSDNERNKCSDFTINNDGQLVVPQVLRILEKL